MSATGPAQAALSNAAAAGSGSSSAYRSKAGHQSPTTQPWTSPTTGAAHMAGTPKPRFTAEMRDRQARGKDPYHSGDVSDGSDLSASERDGMRLGGGGGGGGTRKVREPFGKVERRDWAESILDNPELLMMYAQSTGESIPATRLKFMRMMCAYEDAIDNQDQHRSSRSRSSGQGGRRHGDGPRAGRR